MRKIAQKISKSVYFDYAIIVLVILVALLPITLAVCPMKWDAIDQAFPWRYYVGECVSNGLLPLWTPFSNNGFPQMVINDTWYWLVWLIGATTGFSVKIIGYEYLFHLIIAGIGFYKLGKIFNFDRKIKIILAISYALSGLMVANAQHWHWIFGAAYFVWLYYYLHKIKDKPNLLNSIKLAIVAYLVVASAYPGMTIVIFYIAAVFIAIQVFKLLQNKDYTKLKKYLFYIFIASVMFLLMSVVIIISSIDIIKYLGRGAGMNNDIVFGLNLRVLTSFFIPFSTTINEYKLWETDFSMVNIYIGLFSIILIITSNFVSTKANAKYIRTYTILGIIFIVISMTGIFPFRIWLSYLPFMNFNRQTGLFRLFIIFFFLIAAGYSYKEYLINVKLRKIFNKIVLLLSIFFVIIAIFYFFQVEKWKFKKLITEGFIYFNNIANYNERVLFALFVGIILLLSYFILSKTKYKFTRNLIFIFAILDIAIATILNGFSTIYTYTSAKEVDIELAKMPAKYPIPSLNINMGDVEKSVAGQLPYLWTNIEFFHKIPSSGGSYPIGMFFKYLDKARKHGYYDKMQNYPLLFLANKMSKNLCIDTLSIEKYDKNAIKITNFNSNEIECTVNTDKRKVFTLLQNWHNGWNCYIDNKKVKIMQTNYALISVFINKGTHKVKFEFAPKRIIIAFWISIVSFVIVLILLAIEYYKNNKIVNK